MARYPKIKTLVKTKDAHLGGIYFKKLNKLQTLNRYI